MNVTDIPVSALALAQCRAILGGQYDPLRPFWDRSSERRRRMLLSLADRSPYYAVHAWADLPASIRGPLRGALQQVRDVLNSIPLDPPTWSRCHAHQSVLSNADVSTRGGHFHD